MVAACDNSAGDLSYDHICTGTKLLRSLLEEVPVGSGGVCVLFYEIFLRRFTFDR